VGRMDSVGSELATAERDRLTSADKIQTLDESLTQTSAALDHAVRPTALRCFALNFLITGIVAQCCTGVISCCSYVACRG
jgi:hypothetical protein